MTVEVTLQLSEGLVEEAQRLGSATSKDATTVLTEALEQLWPTLENFSEEAFFPEISQLNLEIKPTFSLTRLFLDF